MMVMVVEGRSELMEMEMTSGTLMMMMMTMMTMMMKKMMEYEKILMTG